jgi:hypothetical protein
MFWSVVTFSLLSAEFFWLSVLPDVQTAAMAVSRDARVAEVVKAAAAGHHRVRHHLLAHIAVEPTRRKSAPTVSPVCGSSRRLPRVRPLEPRQPPLEHELRVAPSNVSKFDRNKKKLDLVKFNKIRYNLTEF